MRRCQELFGIRLLSKIARSSLSPLSQKGVSATEALCVATGGVLAYHAGARGKSPVSRTSRLPPPSPPFLKGGRGDCERGLFGVNFSAIL